MKIGARVQNSEGQHQVTLRTGDTVHNLAVAPKPTGFGSRTNGGELLCLALATCYCNDLYREAAQRGIDIEQVEVEVESEFGAAGSPAENMKYRVRVVTKAGEGEVQALLHHTDRVAEVQNTLRVGTAVTLESAEVVGG